MRILILAVLLFTTFLSSDVFGCSCAWSDPAGSYNKAKFVFVGTMISGTEKHEIEGEKGKQITVESGTVTFKIKKLYKGDSISNLDVQVDSHAGTSCGTYGLARGVDYVVYAFESERKPGVYWTGVCTRTAVATSKYAVDEDLKFLNNLPRKGSGGTLEGRIWLDNREKEGGGATPLRGINVRITGKSTGKSYLAATDKDGEFKLARIPADVYSVVPEVPKKYFVEEKEDLVKVDDLGTGSTEFELYYNSHIFGLIKDSSGRNYNDILLQLENEKHQVYGHGIGKGGQFEVNGIPDGLYKLFIELQHEDYKKNKYYYYPGTFDVSKATPIRIGSGGTVSNIEFRLPPEFRVRTISGSVSWKDGTPATDVEVVFMCPRKVDTGFRFETGAGVVRTDSNGRFSFEGFAETEYFIEARASNTVDPKAIHSKPRKIVLKSDLDEIKVILSETGLSGGCSS